VLPVCRRVQMESLCLPLAVLLPSTRLHRALYCQTLFLSLALLPLRVAGVLGLTGCVQCCSCCVTAQMPKNRFAALDSDEDEGPSSSPAVAAAAPAPRRAARTNRSTRGGRRDGRGRVDGDYRATRDNRGAERRACVLLLCGGCCVVWL